MQHVTCLRKHNRTSIAISGSRFRCAYSLVFTLGKACQRAPDSSEAGPHFIIELFLQICFSKLSSICTSACSRGPWLSRDSLHAEWRWNVCERRMSSPRVDWTLSIVTSLEGRILGGLHCLHPSAVAAGSSPWEVPPATQQLHNNYTTTTQQPTQQPT